MKLHGIPIKFEDTNQEIVARIAKATSRKYNSDVEIDFSNGVRKVIFSGDETMRVYIAGEVLAYFSAGTAAACCL
jgi:hypothetical protein